MTVALVPLLVAALGYLALDRTSETGRSGWGGAGGQTAVVVADALHRWAGLTELTANDPLLPDLALHPGNAEALRPPVQGRLAGLASVIGDDRAVVTLLNTRGAVIAQAVGKQIDTAIRPGSDLSQDQGVAGALTLPAGQLSQTSPHVSTATGAWVITTSIPVTSGAKTVALLSVQIDLRHLRSVLMAAIPDGARARVVETTSGTTVVDTGVEVATPDQNRAPQMQWLPRAARLALGDGRRVESAQIDLGRSGPADWRADAVVQSPETSGPFLWFLLILAAVTALLAWVVTSLRTGGTHRVERTQTAPDAADMPTAPALAAFHAFDILPGPGPAHAHPQPVEPTMSAPPRTIPPPRRPSDPVSTGSVGTGPVSTGPATALKKGLPGPRDPNRRKPRKPQRKKGSGRPIPR